MAVQTAGFVLIAVLFGVIGYYLSLIAKFYRLKFKQGPKHEWMFASLAFLLLGLVFQAPLFVLHIPLFISIALVAAGGIGFSALAFALYRTMMSAN